MDIQQSSSTALSEFKNPFLRLLAIMKAQSEILERSDSFSIMLRDSLYKKEWENLESSLRELENSSRILEKLEAKRMAAVEALCGGRQLTLYIAGLKPEQRREFHSLHSELRARITKVQSRSRGIEAYASSRAKLGEEIMQELIPAKRGRLYDRNGRSAESREVPIVVSRRL